MSENSAQGAEPVSFSEKLASSQAFAGLFKEGMALVEETASYLDGDGRQDSKKLERTAALAYATESMRLTTRLMQLASWLLLHRAVKEGEMSLSQANKEKTKVKLSLGDRADPETMQRYLKACADRHAIRLVDVLPAMRAASREKKLFLTPYDRHPNGTGYAVASEAIGTELARLHWLPGKS